MDTVHDAPGAVTSAKDERPGKFKNKSSTELMGMRIPKRVKLYDNQEISDEEKKNRRLSDNRTNAHNSHLNAAIELALLEERYVYNQKNNVELKETLAAIQAKFKTPH
jgi:hypothetical protein